MTLGQSLAMSSAAPVPTEALLRNSHDLTVVTDRQGIVRYTSPAVLRLLGHATDHWMGEPITALARPLADRIDDVQETDDIGAAFDVTVSDADGFEHVMETVRSTLTVDSEPVVVWNMHDVTGHRRVVEDATRQSMFDPLTGLPNRALLRDRLHHALNLAQRFRRPLAVLFIDLDRFKFVNDTFGHTVGDAVLTWAADRLRSAVRSSETLARFGGDEFVVVCESKTAIEDGVVLADRLVAALTAEPFELDGFTSYVNASVGLTFSTPGSSPDTLLRDADAAMYQAKRTGRGRVVAFNQRIQDAVRRRLLSATEVRRGVDNGEFVAAYQPIVSLRDGAVVGAEALARWRHPSRGELPPHEFIDVADETRLILGLGRQMLQQACRQLAAWRREGVVSDSFTLAVNVAACQLSDDGFVDDVMSALDDSGIGPSGLCLEITESTLIDEAVTASAVLHRLHGLGVRLSLDDFGTGYSSLLYLCRYPVQQLKIDRYFVAGIGQRASDTAVVEGVAGLAKSLGVELIAEGVETKTQLEFLTVTGCEFGQGFFWSTPRPPDEFAVMLRSGAFGASAETATSAIPRPRLVADGAPRPRRDRPPRRVVIVDDDRGDRDFARALLETSSGFVVVGEASDGETALQTAVRERPDLVILDMSMSGLTGLETLSRLRAALPSAHVVVWSSFASRGLAEAVVREGAVTCLDKNMPEDRLVQELSLVADPDGVLEGE